MSSQDVIELIHRAKAQDQNAYNLLFDGIGIHFIHFYIREPQIQI